MSRGSSFIDGVVFGAIIGFLGGILLAPSSGEETRDKLRKVREDNEELIQDTKKTTEEMVSKTLSAIDDGFQRISEMVEKSNGAKNA